MHMTPDARILRVQYEKHCNLLTLLSILLYKCQLNNTKEEVLQVFAEDEWLWWYSTYMLAEKSFKYYASHQTAGALSQQILFIAVFPHI